MEVQKGDMSAWKNVAVDERSTFCILFSFFVTQSHCPGFVTIHDEIKIETTPLSMKGGLLSGLIIGSGKYLPPFYGWSKRSHW